MLSICIVRPTDIAITIFSDDLPQNKRSGDRRPNLDNFEVVTEKPDKVNSDGNRKSSPRDKERGFRRERTAERCEQPKSSRVR